MINQFNCEELNRQYENGKPFKNCIIDDFFDSGNTIEFIINELKSYSPFLIIPVTLFKRYNSQPTINLIYGETINSDEWLVGYGLNGDHNLKRNLPYILGYPKGN